ncbi:NitT/TauT family transport system permease protein [Pseudonocardia kunmingensis]|uniref:NitT/TauT family transport system permease protein n=2 Tax=Pseudonocardia kunmingensis TaxID=630975 RepID=A0A543DQF4_9PSEU|nr:NitT/TauT family transport system permease protein [Pseudonocardia kunmingensis]
MVQPMVRTPVDDTEPVPGIADLGPPAARWYASTRVQATILSVLLLALLLGSWFVAAQQGLVSPLVLAHPADVVAALVDQFSSGTIWPNLWATVYETIAGFTAATVAALLVSFVFAFSAPLRMAVYPYLIMIQTFPKVAIAPLIIAAFGYGLTPKVVIAALMAFFPILVNAMVGLTNVSEDHTNLMRALGASRWQRLRMLQIPNALSYILPGLKSAAVLSLIGVIVAEFVSSREGLGFAIQASSQAGTIDVTYALLIILSAFGLSISLALGLLSWCLRKYRQ